MSLVPYNNNQVGNRNNEITIFEWAVDHYGPVVAQYFAQVVNEHGPRLARRLGRYIRDGVMQETDPELIRLVNEAQYRYESRPTHELARENPQERSPAISDSNLPRLRQGPALPNMTDNNAPGNTEINGKRSADGQNPGNRETPISKYPKLSYGLQETHTTIMPWTCYFGVLRPEYAKPTRIVFRMTSLYDMWYGVGSGTNIRTGFGTATAINGIDHYQIDTHTWNTRNILTKKMLNPQAGTGVERSSFRDFPSELASASGVHAPAWRDYWNSFYQYYTVLSCEWTLTLVPNRESTGANILLGIQYSNEELPPEDTLKYAQTWKHIRWETVSNKAITNGDRVAHVIKGTYKPGQYKRDIKDDDKAETWTEFGTMANPKLQENLVIDFYEHPLSYYNSRLAGSSPYAQYWTTDYPAYNCELSLKFIVQMKDLKNTARYPGTTPIGSEALGVAGSNSLISGNLPQEAVPKWS